eukprot:5135894-Alexandrium_andersonii.AAC.1
MEESSTPLSPTPSTASSPGRRRLQQLRQEIDADLRTGLYSFALGARQRSTSELYSGLRSWTARA